MCLFAGVNGSRRDEEFSADSSKISNNAQTTVAPTVETLPGEESERGIEGEREAGGGLFLKQQEKTLM